MRPVEASELLPLGAYEEIRERFRARIIEAKRARYVRVGQHMTVLFENRDTVLFQIQEMLRTERITQDRAIDHELATYNELIPGDHQLSATVFVEYTEREQREEMLRELRGLETCFYLEAFRERAQLIPDERGTDPTRTMAVHYVKFVLPERVERAIREMAGPITLGVEHPAYREWTTLSAQTLHSLQADFS
jgi:DNA-directed RNA polymerase subunit K/omega